MIAQDPDDNEARYLASAVKIWRDDYEGALEQLLEIVRRDDNFREQAGRNSLLAIFAILGEEDERVRRYRILLSRPCIKQVLKRRTAGFSPHT